MIISYFRSSSYNNWDFCQQQYFISYVLGQEQQSNKKADKGTIVHKVLECLAQLNLAMVNEQDFFIDEHLGKIKFNPDTVMKVTKLDDEEVDKINKTRKNKSTYKNQNSCMLKHGAKRYGVEIVEKLIDMSYEYYTSRITHHKWMPVDFKDCTNFVWMALDYKVGFKQGIFDPRNRDIIAVEPHFDFELDEEWANYEFLNNKGEMTSGKLSLKGTIDLVTKVNDNTIEVIDWKGLPVSTPIPTINGWKTMGELQVGDILFDKDGEQTRVLEKSKKSYKPCYKITFDDITTAICDNEHLWLLDDGSIVEAPELKIGDKIDISKPIKCDNYELPIDPYVLGIWIGDGRNRSGEITSGDTFVFDEIVRRGYKLGVDSEKRSDGRETRTVLGLTTKLKSQNLINNKHIPMSYMRASYKDRLDLLRGLMDSDGNANPSRKQAVFTTCNKMLSDDVKSLLLTLGQRVNQSSINRDTNFKKDISVYPLAFRPIDINPFLIPRKRNIIKKEWGPGRSNKRRIVGIELMKIELETQCIMVDSPSNTYLCTENMIPTHNTGQRLNWGTGKVKTYEDIKKDPQLLLYNRAIRHLYPEFKNVICTLFFIRDGGPFSVALDESHSELMEKNVKKRYHEITATTRPKMRDVTQKDWRCKSLCGFYKQSWPNTKYNLCRYIHEHTKKFGIEKTVQRCTKDGHSVDEYSAPGEV